MRLIDADALKKVIHCEYSDDLGILDKIDNAPTVKYPFYQEAYQTGYEEGKNERPQSGEWIDHSEDYGYAECPFCHELTNCGGNIDELHYCWNCGAEMRKGTENEQKMHRTSMD